MKLLAIDTSTEACSAAVLIGGEVLEEYALAPRQHTHMILPMVKRLLAESGMRLKDMDGIAFARGPGAFTGLRIAAGVTQGLAFGAELPVMPVSSLAALAHGAWRVHGATKVLTALDARMHEVYWGSWVVKGTGDVAAESAECVRAPAMLTPPDEAGDWYAVGPGWQTYNAELLPRFARQLGGRDAAMLPRAHDVALLGAALVRQRGWLTADQAQPVYLRDNVADKSKNELLKSF